MSAIGISQCIRNASFSECLCFTEARIDLERARFSSRENWGAVEVWYNKTKLSTLCKPYIVGKEEKWFG